MIRSAGQLHESIRLTAFKRYKRTLTKSSPTPTPTPIVAVVIVVVAVIGVAVIVGVALTAGAGGAGALALEAEGGGTTAVGCICTGDGLTTGDCSSLLRLVGGLELREACVEA